MKKALILLLFIAAINIPTSAQSKLDDFGRIVLNTYLPNNLGVPAEAKKSLETKLNQITSKYGLGGSQVNPRFIITAKVNVGSKDIIAGPPQMIAQNIDVTLIIGDAGTNTIYSNVTLSLKGVGTNENKAIIEAFKTINAQNKEVLAFLEEGKSKIIAYYSTNCDFLIKNANTLVKQNKFDEAIYDLSLVPDVCQDCYYKCLDILAKVYQQKIDVDGQTKLNNAKTKWTAQQNGSGAEKAGDILSSINPLASCQPEISKFIKVIDAKLKADERANWQLKVKKYQDEIALQKEHIRIAEEKSKRDDQYRENADKRNNELDIIHVNACREVAVEYAKHQPKTTTYNNIFWK